MARVPTLAELRMDIDKLAKIQKECYDSVHYLLDPGLTELDRKIAYLMHNCRNEVVQSKPKHQVHESYTDEKSKPCQLETLLSITDNFDHSAYPEPELETLIDHKQAGNTVTDSCHNGSNVQGDLISNHISNYEHTKRQVFEEPLYQSIDENFLEENKYTEPVHSKKHDNHVESTNGSGDQKISKQKKMKNVDELIKRRNHNLRYNKDRKKHFEETVQKYNLNLDELEHLQPPQMPLSEYLKRNRPDIVMNAEARTFYIKKLSEERKTRASRITNSLERISSRARRQSQFKRIDNHFSQKPMRDFSAPDYLVRYKQSEREMKQLTLRTYKRLPEVRKQKMEELKTVLRVQNYKNRLLYGKMLLSNRRQGIINYPLRNSYDDRSITSSQSEYSMSGCGRSADTYSPDTYN